MTLTAKPPAPPRNERDLWAWWPDDFMCPLSEVEEMMNPPCARSDDYMVVEVMEYDGTGSPQRWAKVD